MASIVALVGLPEERLLLAVVAEDLAGANRVRIRRRHVALIDEGWAAAVLVRARNVLQGGPRALALAGALEAGSILSVRG